MAEGGQLPWKRQTIDLSRGPPADYSTLRKSLPAPPGEWKLVEQQQQQEQSEELVTEGTKNLEEEKEEASYKKEEPRDEKGVDYVFHTVLPSDTLAGLCLRYRISATKLRQANKFSGSNLFLAPARLLIPLTDQTIVNNIQVQDTTSPEFKLQAFLGQFPHLRQSERRAYLEMNDWDLAEAMKNAADDDAWEKAHNTEKETQRAAAAHSLTRLNVHGQPLKKNRAVVAPSFAEECPTEGLLEPLLKKEVELAQRLT